VETIPWKTDIQHDDTSPLQSQSLLNVKPSIPAPGSFDAAGCEPELRTWICPSDRTLPRTCSPCRKRQRGRRRMPVHTGTCLLRRRQEQSLTSSLCYLAGHESGHRARACQRCLRDILLEASSNLALPVLQRHAARRRSTAARLETRARPDPLSSWRRCLRAGQERRTACTAAPCQVQMLLGSGRPAACPQDGTSKPGA